jgi:hypothetical protein
VAKNPGTVTTTTRTTNPSGGAPVTSTRVMTPGSRDPNKPPAPRDDRPRNNR